MCQPFVLLSACLVLLGLLAGCEPFPRDPGESLQHVHERGTLRVGVLYGPPWVMGGAPGAAGGVEGRLVREFARRQEARLETQWGSEQERFDSLRHHELDLIIGGLTTESPWHSEVGFTAPYYTGKVAIAVRQGEPIPDDAEGLTVWIPHGSHLYDELRRHGAEVKRVPELSASTGAIAARQWEIKGLGYQASDIVLQERHHVMAIPRGENALLMELERFLAEFVESHDMDRLIWETSRQ
ncbi:polar amino acid transport system substrate-binding protein [Halopseudomonas xinjiangensis]|uniref:Polar amino acid transport system substrate-binding protein n=1 Tax=Halopseudomonas xinjiangensis TaxID=487184 RepID=A0A1H1W8W8_9GAMM|nr:transporter substrate-binding domain-containing protein [Halopseudomonas xinjiangensis]SDS93101.1 polar amino acid transport system substrate-binding protein [Halopseudomonas xinjiangensis]